MITQMNLYGKTGTPFFFMIDFDMAHPVIIPLSDLKQSNILFNINGFKNYHKRKCRDADRNKLNLEKYPVSFEIYRSSFEKAVRELRAGNSYLINLTFPAKIKINRSLRELFFMSEARYKLLYHDQFLVFSPESFVRIKNNRIYSFPMKGTINAGVFQAGKKLISDKKELAEHITIVDLLRNDLSMVSKNVKVEKFRTIDKIKTNSGGVLQTSSVIAGELNKDWRNEIGSIIKALLPPGSVTGAPKKKTVEIIKKIENYDRGWYTGIFGCFDGQTLDSGVMIRFIEKKNNQLYYKSGGGITVYSDVKKEYDELVEKIYVPVC